MSDFKPSFVRRVALAFGSFFSIIGRPDFAAAVAGIRERGHSGEERPAGSPELREAPHEAALQLLAMLQREARFVDFVEEDMAAYGDADIGAAARVVHQGCRKVLREYFTLEPLRAESEGSRITLDAGFDASAIRLAGNVVGEPPFSGRLTHCGWRATDSRLPKLAAGHDARIIAQAEVEL